MSQLPQVLWLGVNPSLQHFDRRLCRRLSRQVGLQYWCYHQSADEPCSIQAALTLLDDYLQSQSQPVHLIGHGLSGALGLLYTRLYAHRVKSLTLLSVGAHPAVSWHAHYYVLRNRLPCDRSMILMQMANMLFYCQSRAKLVGLAQLLEKVLDSELAPHSLVEHQPFSPGGVEVPLLVCRGAHDVIVDPHAHAQWQSFLKPGDRLWTCPEGRHFFHHTHGSQTSDVIFNFWHQMSSRPAQTPLIEVLSR